jgi:hypothetical protein
MSTNIKIITTESKLSSIVLDDPFRFAPLTDAHIYSTGTIKTGSDNKKWIVKLHTNGIKTWVRLGEFSGSLLESQTDGCYFTDSSQTPKHLKSSEIQQLINISPSAVKYTFNTIQLMGEFIKKTYNVKIVIVPIVLKTDIFNLDEHIDHIKTFTKKYIDNAFDSNLTHKLPVSVIIDSSGCSINTYSPLIIQYDESISYNIFRLILQKLFKNKFTFVDDNCVLIRYV